MKPLWRSSALGCALLLCGCTAKLIDPCAGVTGTCVALYVDSAPPLDELDIQLTGPAGINDVVSHSPHDKAFSPPIAVAIVLDASLVDPSPAEINFDVTGKKGGIAVGEGQKTANVKKGARTEVHVTLTSGADLATAGDDLSGDDLAGDDLSSGDGSSSGDASSSIDLSTADLIPPTAISRLISPLSGASVAILTPTVTWELAPGLGSAEVDFCVTRACDAPIPGVDATIHPDGHSAGPSVNLPPGWIYWRVRIRNGTSVTSTPVWQFWVPRRDGALDVSHGVTLDVNGDGHADFLVGAAESGAGFVHLFLGGAGGTLAEIDINAPDQAGQEFGISVAAAGDVNGDGFGDFLIGARSNNAAYLYLGEPNPDGSDWNAATTGTRFALTGPQTAIYFGASVAGVGDVNGDGYADFVVGAPDALTNTDSSAYVYLGEARPTLAHWNGLGSAPLAGRINLVSPAGPGVQFGGAVAGVGDVNADGFGDFVVGAIAASGNKGAAYVYFGVTSPGPTVWNGPSPAPKRIDLTSIDGTNSDFGQSVAGAGDINDDGYSDFLIGAPDSAAGNGVAHVYFGDPSPSPAFWNGPPSPAPKRIDLVDPDGSNASFAYVSGAGDVNGDGYDDFLVGAPNSGSGTGAAHLFLGEGSPVTAHWNGASPADRFTLTAPVMYGSFGLSLAGCGDLDGDGLSDFLVAAPNYSTMTGEVYLYFGELSPFNLADWNGASPPKRLALDSPDPNGAGYGISLARLELRRRSFHSIWRRFTAGSRRES